jgi:hypothetical protein
MQRSRYLRGLQEAILAVHGVNSRHTGSTPVKEIFQGRTAWEGEVEAFDLVDHPKAKRAYAWAYDDNGTLRTTAVLVLPPVDSPESAVKVAIASSCREATK